MCSNRARYQNSVGRKKKCFSYGGSKRKMTEEDWKHLNVIEERKYHGNFKRVTDYGDRNNEYTSATIM